MQFAEEVCSVLSELLVKESPMYGRLLCPNNMDQPTIYQQPIVYLRIFTTDKYIHIHERALRILEDELNVLRSVLGRLRGRAPFFDS